MIAQPPPALPDRTAPVPSEDERTMAMLCHLLGIVTALTLGLGFLGPLILWLVKKDSSPFIDHHGKEAVNFQLTVLLATICLSAVTFALMKVLIGFLLIPAIIGLVVVALILEILACTAAQRGEWHRYPACIRFIS